MADLPPFAQGQQRQLVPYNNAGKVPIAGVNGGGELATLAQAVGQGATGIAQEFYVPTMAMKYQEAINGAPMSNTERLMRIMPAADIIGGGLLTGAKVPRNALASNAVRREGAETLPEVEEIVAYHGSPHNFDKFQMGKIGTGEGAQAYGHGLYYTDLEDIATGYEKSLTPRDLDYEEWLMGKYKQAENAQDYSRLDMYERALMHDKPSDFRSIANDADYDDDYRALASEVADEIEEYGPKFGATYKVSIQSKLDEMLDYDEPLLDQPIKVQNAIRNIYKNFAYKNFPNTEPPNGWQTGKLTLEEMRHMGLSDNASGSNAYRLISEKLNPKKFTPKAGMSTDQIRKGIREEYKSGEVMMSDLLNREGINGMRYLDANSRNAPYEIKLSTKKGPYDTEKISASSKRQAEQLADDYKEKGFKTEIVKSGTNNYVIFNEDLVKILAKYGIVGGASLAAVNEFSAPAQANEYPNYMPPQAPELDANPARLLRGLLPNEA